MIVPVILCLLFFWMHREAKREFATEWQHFSVCKLRGKQILSWESVCLQPWFPWGNTLTWVCNLSFLLHALCFYASLLDSLISVDLVGFLYFNSTSWQLYGYLRFSSIVDAYMYMFKLRARMAKSNNRFFFFFCPLYYLVKWLCFQFIVSNVAGSNFVKQWC